MKIEQIYTGCLAQGAYYIESDGEAAIIDPLREVDPYLELAERRGARIRYIFETHFHADFVSGHVDLAKKTGASIVFGPTSARTGFELHRGQDGEEFALGSVRIRLIHTPGHTLESSCYLLFDEQGRAHALFTGDTLFIGDVGRPDLAQSMDPSLTQEVLAGMLYDSLRTKIMPLPGSLIVYPAHGAGSACGKNMRAETSDTLANQLRTNYALSPDLSREDFIVSLTSGLTTPPAYFPENVRMNIDGYTSIDEVLARGIRPIEAGTFLEWSGREDMLVLDTRHPMDFSEGFIPGAISIGIDGNFAVWVGTLIPDLRQPLLVVADPGREREVITRLARVGFDHAAGYLKGGIEAWKQAGFPLYKMKTMDLDSFSKLANAPGEVEILDVRKAHEFEASHLEGARNLPLDSLNDHLSTLDPHKKYAVHCAGGYRSMIFCSILKARGFDQLTNVSCSFAHMRVSGRIAVSEHRCPTALL
ncbi:MAG: MBL fold metallo-hydrolase [Saprospiraceae bacterium]|nr:MBL fold metallo-hydrolase [Saprospiraceae bacterium]